MIQMRPVLTLLAAVFSILFLSGCMTTSGSSNSPKPTDIYYVQSFDVKFSEDARINKSPRLDKPESEQTGEQVKSYIEHSLKASLKETFVGQKPAKLDVLIHRIETSSGPARLIGVASYMSSDVTLSDLETGNVIKNGFIKTEQIPARATGNIGIVLMVAANAGTSKEKRREQLADQFSLDVTSWAKQ